jgi:hypothetical protein
MSTRIFVILSLLPVLASPAAAEDRPSAGRSTRHIAGLRVEFLVPTDAQLKEGASLLVILHGMGGEAANMVGIGQPMLEKGFVTVAPKSTGPGWTKPDVDVVRRIAKEVIGLFEVPLHRRHCAGFSNGGYNLTPLAFDPDLHFRSACWIASSFSGGKPPRWAKNEMACLGLVGSEDGARASAIKITSMLGKKVKFVDYRVQRGLGHQLPREYVPWWFYVCEVMEGRFTPGDQRSYEWTEELATAKRLMAARKRGGFVYVYDPDAKDEEREATKRVQNEVLFDRVVGHYGRQLLAVKLPKAKAAGLLAEAKAKATPALIVFRPGGEKIAKVLTGRISTGRAAGAFRSVARNKAPPD